MTVLSAVLSLIMLGLLGAAFGVAGTFVARRYDRSSLIYLWLAVSAAYGSIGALRAVAYQRSLGRGPDHVSAPGMYAMLIVAMLVILSVPTFQIWRRTPRNPEVAYGQRALAASGWAYLGTLLMLAIAILLDLANVNFVPFR